MGFTFVIIAGVLVVVGFVAYLFLMIFYPEWVGITSKEEREALKKKYEGYEKDRQNAEANNNLNKTQ